MSLYFRFDIEPLNSTHINKNTAWKLSNIVIPMRKSNKNLCHWHSTPRSFPRQECPLHPCCRFFTPAKHLPTWDVFSSTALPNSDSQTFLLLLKVSSRHHHFSSKRWWKWRRKRHTQMGILSQKLLVGPQYIALYCHLRITGGKMFQRSTSEQQGIINANNSSDIIMDRRPYLFY